MNEVLEFFTWDFLMTFAGATAATVFIVQFLKLPLDKVWKIPTQFLVYVVAFIIMVTATYFTKGLTFETFALTFFNSFLVAVSAMGLYSKAIKNPEEIKNSKE